MSRQLSVNWNTFDPKLYLREYYNHIGPENEVLLSFLVSSFKKVPIGSEVLDFGTGPTAYQLIAAARVAKTVDCAEFLEVNRKELEKWVNDRPGRFNWRKYTSRIMELEDGSLPSDIEVKRRERDTKSKIRVMRGDATKVAPLNSNRRYDVLSVHFVPESITDSKQKYVRYLSNIMTILKPSGYFIMSAIIGAKSYKAGKHTFPAVPVSKEDLIKEVINNGIIPDSIQTSFVPAEKSQGYNGLLFLFGEKG